MPDDSVKPAVEKLFHDFAILSHVGFSGGALAGEKGTYRLAVPFTGRVMEGITILSNMPMLPYGANPTRLVQSATFNWLYALTHQLYTESDQVKMLHTNYEWELKMMRTTEEGRQLRLFREYLAQRTQELDQFGHAVEVLRDLKTVCQQAPTPSLVTKCSHLVAENATVMQTLKTLPIAIREEMTQWLEPYVH
jgi:hypothetical protein